MERGKNNIQKNCIYNGDCLELMPLIPDKSIDMILCDLPYGTTACKWDTIIPFKPLWEQYKRIIKNNGAIVLTASQPFTTILINSNMNLFHCEWIWHKSKPSGVAFTTQPMRNHEQVLVFGKIKTFNAIHEEREGFTESSIKRFASGENLGSYRNHGNSTTGMSKTELKKIERLRKPTTIKKFASVPNRLGTLHPTQKPVALFEYLIKTYTNEGDLVLDNCAGSGTTAIACINTKRNYICIEKDKKYFDIAEARIKAWEIEKTSHIISSFSLF